MPEFAVLLIVLAIVVLGCGPLALIIALVALNRLKALEQQLNTSSERTQPRQDAVQWNARHDEIVPTRTAPQPVVVAAAADKPITAQPEPLPSQDLPAEQLFHTYIKPPAEPEIVKPPVPPEPVAAIAEAGEKFSLEVLLGTKWLAIAGSIAVLVGVIFGLKYLYDNGFIGALGRTLIVAAAGLIAVGVGQWTRVRGYDIVAKSLTALGFALLYAADFAAFGFYHLIGTEIAFGFAIAITACGLLYAMALDEVIMAFLSLLGGFLSPVFLSTGENRPGALFGYVTILSVGAMLCGMKRKWRSINVLAFVGTAILYTVWFEKFYEPTIYQAVPPQLGIAVAWIGIFFAIFLVMPAIYGLVQGREAQREDVGLIVSNAMFAFIWLSRILYGRWREYLALAAVILCAAHLAMMIAVSRRVQQDKALRLSLLVIGLFFLTIAVPLYLKLYAVAIAWTGEGMVLCFIAIRYRSVFTQVASLAATGLGVVMLFHQLPLHNGTFVFIVNPQFVSWLFVAAAIYTAHWFYRTAGQDELPLMSELTQLLFCGSLVLLLIVGCMEWYKHTQLNWYDERQAGLKGILGLLGLFSVLLMLPRFKPKGLMPFFVSTLLAAGTFFAALAIIPQGYRSDFAFIFNSAFATGVFATATIYVCHLLYRFVWNKELGSGAGSLSQVMFCGTMILLLAAAAIEWNEHSRRIATSGLSHDALFMEGLLVLLAAGSVATMAAQFAPQGAGPVVLAVGFAASSLLVGLTQLPGFHEQEFVVFLNGGFALAILPVCALAVNGTALYQRNTSLPMRHLSYGYGLAILFYIWLILTEELYLYWNNPLHAFASTGSIDKGQMWISIMWALYAAMVMGAGLWKRIVMLRYIGFGFFTLVLVKVFLFDMSRLKGIYQIAGFTLLGMVLIGMSYLYQYLRKQGFFETRPQEKA